MKIIKKWFRLPVLGLMVLPATSRAADPSGTDSFWNNAATEKPAAKPATPAPRPPEPPPAREPKPSVSVELMERLDALEKRVAELSAPKETAPAAPSWTTGYKDGGGGFFWASPDQNFILKLLGYAQMNHQWVDANGARLRAAGVTPTVSNDFYVKRSRLDFSATVFKNTELYIEFEGGVGTSASSASDFAMVESKITHKLVDACQFRFGKFLVPFSNENALRSSRALDTAERYAALNTLVALPSIEIQNGFMVMGNWAKKRYDYALGVFNGNGRAADNYRDNNSQKNLVGHFTWKPLAMGKGPISGLAFGVGMDWDRETAQTLSLKTLGGTTLSNSYAVTGDRLGFSGDVNIPATGFLEIRGEGLFERFNDSRTNLYGGFVQALFPLLKTEKGGGFSPLVRAESAVISEGFNKKISRMNILTLGWNLNLNRNVCWKLNYVPTHYRSTGESVSTKMGHHDEVLNQVQVKF